MTTAIVRRRRFLMATGVVAAAPMLAFGQMEGKINPDEGVTAPEDLMKEHGVLNRCLLIYEEGMRRLRKRQDVSPEVFNHTAQLIRTFFSPQAGAGFGRPHGSGREESARG